MLEGIGCWMGLKAGRHWRHAGCSPFGGELRLLGGVTVGPCLAEYVGIGGS